MAAHGGAVVGDDSHRLDRVSEAVAGVEMQVLVVDRSGWVLSGVTGATEGG